MTPYTPCSSTYGRFYLSILFDLTVSQLKSNPNTKSRSKSIITRKFVIDFYQFPIIVDWLVQTFIDNDRFLSTIRIIDMLHTSCKTTSLTLLSWCNSRGVNSTHHCHYTMASSDSKFDGFCLQCIQFEIIIKMLMHSLLVNCQDLLFNCHTL